ncbi:efflux RND transporter permease subunit [Cognatiyoonia sp. IB215446]|uniref:efflux RND transporter permease subunit n=1 Tax=Cognatiyoonia sp. IB215446 TaxID=3097355 RepID=UPI002A0EB58C|nr:efflux RND transporter permease subunit [Cognatiyoonia sp. IB215446]MDX8350048.1 efflux RND transporter permease subunit [Cognatiyoonia sp. IB215446]
MISYFARHPIAANLVLIAVAFLGFSVLSAMERESFPEFASTEVSVSVTYPGASASDVDEQVCLVLDEALGAVNNLDELQCLSVENRATATLTMAEGGDIGQFYNDVSSEVSSINGFPADAEGPSVSILGQTEAIASIAISGIDTRDGLIRFADELAGELASLSRIATADVTGISEAEFRISFDQSALRRFGISPQDVSNAVSERSLRAPLGTVQTTGREVTLRYFDARRSLSDLENLVLIENDAGGIVRLIDVAQITLTEVSPELQSFIDGERAAIVQVSKRKDDDAIEAFDQVEALLAEVEARYPETLNLTVVSNMTENVEIQINLVLQNAMMSLALVVLVMCLFFSISEAVWISLALPFSFLGGIFAMSLFSITINMISLIALLMAIGLIMDDSIVIADNIAKWRRSMGIREAAVRGATEVMPGVLSSFLTTACVFGPLMFLSGGLGAILKVIPAVLLLTLMASLIEAFLILPNHMSHTKGDPEKNAQRFVPRMLDRIRDGLVIPVASALMKVRYLTLSSVFAILIVTVGVLASGMIKIIGFPATDGDTIEARIALSSGLPIERTEDVVAQIIAGLDAVDAAYTPSTEGGQPLVQRVLVSYATNRDVKDNGPYTATITVDLLGSDLRNAAADDILTLWREETGPIADVVQSNFAQVAGGPGGSDLDVELRSRDLAQLEAASGRLQAELIQRDDVTEAFQDFFGGRPEIRLALNEFGYVIGLTPQAITSQLRSAFSGTETDTFRQQLSDVSVRVELGDTVPTIADLEQFPLTVPGGDQVALGTIADIEVTSSYAQITRRNGLAVASIVGNIDRDATTANEISRVITDELGPLLQADFPDVTISIGGAAESTNEASTSIMIALLTGLVGVYLILAFQFHSYTLPFMIMLSIPFALIGTVFGHMALGMDISMPSFIGFASLAGVVVNNAILFMTFFEAEIEGDDYLTAAIEAVRHRFRPVMLSFSTTFVGLIPMVFETSPQAAVLVPLVAAVAFGLLASTILIIFVFPSIIGIYFDIADVRKWEASRQGHGDELVPGASTAEVR